METYEFRVCVCVCVRVRVCVCVNLLADNWAIQTRVYNTNVDSLQLVYGANGQ